MRNRWPPLKKRVMKAPTPERGCCTARLPRTAINELLGATYPIIQTAMGWVAKPELVAAACNAGAFGFLACAVMNPDEVGVAIDRVRALTDRPFGVNFHMFQPGAPRIVETIIEKRVVAVSFGRGPDRDMIARFKANGIKCVPTVGALKHARKMVDLGVDMLVVQGGEGGGHTGSVPSTVLLPQVLEAVDIPVIACGGFCDGLGLAAALAYGAHGIAMGTRFLMTSDSPVPAATKQRYVAATTEDIFVTDRLDGVPQRMIRNRLTARLERASSARIASIGLLNALRLRKRTGVGIGEMVKSALDLARSGHTTMSQALMAANAPMLIQRAIEQGSPDEGVMATGLVAGRLSDLPSCEDLVRSIVKVAHDRLEALGQRAPTASLLAKEI
jgi:NAD(P)H-dependent flavin oxidoreductase YrpB (nitropropane dioxygenase family)